jgi:thiamine-phosphate pyrophosphorylase
VANYQFTQAAGRAIQAAAAWTGGGSLGQISSAELLLGLLAESESRAAEMLALHGVDTAAVMARWPNLVSAADRGAVKTELSTEVHDALSAAAVQLTDFPRPLELATEHLLLGLVAADDELADWLSERGFAADALTDEICRLYGYRGNGDEAVALPALPANSGDQDREQLGPPSPQPRVPARGCGGRGRHKTPRNATEGVLYRVPDVQPQTAVLRLIDAAANRAREGLRVVEDFVRFVWDDRHLMAQLKQLRHELAVVLLRLSVEDLLASRDTIGDVGTSVSTAAENNRADAASVVAANFKRLQEALRSIEEFGKVLDPTMAAQVEQLRYRAYTLERAVAATTVGLRRLADARLYVLIDGRDSLDTFTELVGTLVSAGVDVLQLRDKQLTDRELLARAHRLRELTIDTQTLFIMNDRPDLAVLAEADGAHVGQDELSVSACRAIVGPRALIGVSTHSLEQARQAVLDGANYLGVGPTFASRTKRFDEGVLQGTDLLKAVHAEVGLPAFAIGGIDRGNLQQVLDTGFTRVAVSGAVLSAELPGDAARQMLAVLKNGHS